MKDNIPEGFYNVCDVNSLKEKRGKRFIINDIDIAVFKVDGTIYALQNQCPHQHSQTIYDGIVENCKVACPVHGWEFNLSDGKMDTGRRGLDTYEVVVHNGEVYVKADKKELNW